MNAIEYETLRKKIHKIAEEGKAAAVRRDIKRAAELAREIAPLVKQLAELTGSQKYHDLAKKYHDLAKKGEDLASEHLGPPN